jgi:hypothetical protein
VLGRRQVEKGNIMSPESNTEEAEMRPEYDFRGGGRGKYYKQ